MLAVLCSLMPLSQLYAENTKIGQPYEQVQTLDIPYHLLFALKVPRQNQSRPVLEFSTDELPTTQLAVWVESESTKEYTYELYMFDPATQQSFALPTESFAKYPKEYWTPIDVSAWLGPTMFKLPMSKPYSIRYKQDMFTPELFSGIRKDAFPQAWAKEFGAKHTGGYVISVKARAGSEYTRPKQMPVMFSQETDLLYSHYEAIKFLAWIRKSQKKQATTDK
jgi:hypothetical protein